MMLILVLVVRVVMMIEVGVTVGVVDEVVGGWLGNDRTDGGWR